jgi:hypothetical protein
MRHTHTFEVHYAVKTGFMVTAWVRWDLLEPDHSRHGHPDKLWMYRCTVCGEQGYEVPA